VKSKEGVGAMAAHRIEAQEAAEAVRTATPADLPRVADAMARLAQAVQPAPPGSLPPPPPPLLHSRAGGLLPIGLGPVDRAWPRDAGHPPIDAAARTDLVTA
jgi:hypothetical protein